jgi:2-amino-4-hydroxy-6-hydroxymethyldihydropteridine diphosphokinase
VINQDILEKQVKIAYLSIGSNLGNRIENIEKAKFELVEKGVFIIRSSKYYETLSWPDAGKPKFYNIVLKIKTKLGKIELLRICKEIEKFLGRKNTPKNSPRECDIDILDYEKLSFNNGINLPHPRMHVRNFVLFPLFEVDSNWRHPVSKQHIKTLIFSLSNRDISSIKQI